jgi:hypothetical protein
VSSFEVKFSRCECLRANSLSQGKSIAIPRGRQPASRTRIWCLRVAGAYANAAKGDGVEINGTLVKVNDPQTINTMKKWFGVDRATVQNWKRQWASGASDQLDDVEATSEGLSKALGCAASHYRAHPKK